MFLSCLLHLRGEIQGDEARIEGKDDGDRQNEEDDGQEHRNLASPAFLHEGRERAFALVARLARTLTTAIERGSPLASVLHDQARDQRERSLAALMEEGGRREIAMLLPVVFLILPVTVIFALYPGLIALDFTP